MYEELVRDLRDDADWAEKSPDFTIPTIILYEMRKAADAIEELKQHYCPHAIRNVHDRGDDSICRVLGTEPKEE